MAAYKSRRHTHQDQWSSPSLQILGAKRREPYQQTPVFSTFKRPRTAFESTNPSVPIHGFATKTKAPGSINPLQSQYQRGVVAFQNQGTPQSHCVTGSIPVSQSRVALTAPTPTAANGFTSYQNLPVTQNRAMSSYRPQQTTTTVAAGTTFRAAFVQTSSFMSYPAVSTSMAAPAVQEIAGTPLRFDIRSSALPPLPTCPPLPLQVSSQVPVTNNQLLDTALLQLIHSLTAQGVKVEPTTETAPAVKETPVVEETIPLEFDNAWLKKRHESVINALYSDLPRQCSACGQRFKCQEEHSKHMDWHVRKNRTLAKNKKIKPSRNWFLRGSMWLVGNDEAPTTVMTLPHQSLRTGEAVVEKGEEEPTVPADEDQRECALCGEHFEDFYSDETEDWMYKGAVYMKAPKGSTTSRDRSLLGPIVHAKCLF